MIAVVLVKEVDPAVEQHEGALLTPADCFQMAADLYYQSERLRWLKHRRHDFVVEEFAALSPERQWEFFHQAMVAVQQFEQQREAMRA